MTLTAADARRWIQGFEAAGRADIETRRRQGPRPAWSIALSLSLLRAAAAAAGGRVPADPGRLERDETVRAVWNRLQSNARQ